MSASTSPNRRHRRSRATSPGGRVAAITLVMAIAVGGCRDATSLAGPTWQWTAQQANSSGQPAAGDPDRYTIEFLADGTVNVRADCNAMTGTYAVAVPLDLTIAIGTPADAACRDASLDHLYLESLGRVESYSTDNGELMLFFADDVGGMRFTSPGS